MTLHKRSKLLSLTRPHCGYDDIWLSDTGVE